MFQKGKKLCSTPMKIESGNSSLSLSGIKSYSSDNPTLVKMFNYKCLERVNVDWKSRHQKKLGNYKELVRKIRGRQRKESSTSNSEWEDQRSLNNSRDNKNEATPPLFESPERQRDLGVEKDYVLSPPLIDPKRRNVPAIEDEVVNKEEEEKKIFSLDENIIETDNSSPIFDRSKVGRTYTSMKKKKWEDRLSTNKGSGDWLIDLQLPTATANLLWENYIKDHQIKLPQLQINDIEKDDPRKERNDEDNNTEIDDILALLNEEQRRLLKCNKLYKIKGGFSRRNGVLPMEVQKYVKVNGQWKKCVTKRDEDTDCLSERTSHVKIKSVVKLEAVVYKRSDGNFGIIEN